MSDLAWAERAACKGYPTDWWFPHATEQAQEAKRICASCPVKGDCLRYAEAETVGGRVLDGVWGGLSFRQRRSLRTKVS